MRSQILHLVIEFFLRAVPWHGSLGTSRARKAVSGQGFQNTFAVAHEICLWALAPHASYVSQKVIMLHQSTVRLRVVLNTGFAVLREKNNRPLHVWGVTPRRGVAGVTGCLRYRRDYVVEMTMGGITGEFRAETRSRL